MFKVQSNEFEKFWMEYLHYQVKTERYIKIVKMKEEYLNRLNSSLPDGVLIGEGIPYEIDNEIENDYIFID